MASIVVIAVIIILVGALVFWLINNRKAEAWSGTVEDKKERTTTDSEGYDSTSYYLVVKRDDGQTKSVSVSKKLYDSFAVGDKVLKEAGKYNPTKA